MNTTIKSIFKGVLTIIGGCSLIGILAFAEAETNTTMFLGAGTSAFILYLSAKGLDKLGTSNR